jgi:hypothetical protein
MRFPVSCGFSEVSPVALPPGPGEAVHEPSPERITAVGKDDRRIRSNLCRRNGGLRAGGDNDVEALFHQVARQVYQPILAAVRVSLLNHEILPRDIAHVVQASAKRGSIDRVVLCRAQCQPADHGHRPLARRRTRQQGRV